MSHDEYRFSTRPSGDVVIFHQGKLAKLLRDSQAAEFLAAVKDGDPQEAMAQVVGHEGQSSRPGGSLAGPGGGAHGDGMAHGHKEFRRKSG